MPPVAPTFAPGSGWCETGMWSPGSEADKEAMRRAALPCSVFILRHRGERLPTTHMLASAPVIGHLLCRQEALGFWSATVYSSPSMAEPVLRDGEVARLRGAQLLRENAGVRLYQGWQWNTTATKRYTQSWLCTPSPERGREILLAMAGD